jgi:hypothetical protein
MHCAKRENGPASHDGVNKKGLPPMKRFVFCAGFGREFRGEPFVGFSEARLQQAMNRTARGEDVSAVSFDVGSGTVKTTSKIWKNGVPKITKDTQRLFDPINIKNYKRPADPRDPLEFKDGQPGVMSITDVYKRIIDIGKSDPGSISEVSIFSHAFYEGPILVNSNDDGYVSARGLTGRVERVAIPPGMRDPDDKDGRSFKEFVSPNMIKSDAKAFTGAFDSTGYCWVGVATFPSL